MFKKIVSLSLLVSLMTVSASSQAQDRDFRKERADLARAEKAQKRSGRIGNNAVVTDYGNNIIRIIPFTAMDIGVGFGLSYESIVSKDKVIGIHLPFYLMTETNLDNFNNNNSSSFERTYFYFNPGIKIYPMGQRRVTYAVGPSLMFGYGGGKEWDYSSNNFAIQKDVTRLRVGLLINNYLNFQLSPALNMGIDLGLGVRYIDRTQYKDPTNNAAYDVNKGIGVSGQFGFSLGYRF
jgi:hypothetical protein